MNTGIADMTTTEQRLADALRAVIDTAPGGVRANEADNIAAKRDSILALAAYDAQQIRQPCRYLVRWEVDSDDATPEEAARAADGNTSRFYEVIEDNGTVNYVDLDAIDGEGA